MSVDADEDLLVDARIDGDTATIRTIERREKTIRNPFRDDELHLQEGDEVGRIHRR